MKTVFYKKEGGRFIPVSEHDTNFCDSYAYGSYLVSSLPNVLSRRSVDPAFVLMYAATYYCEDAIAKVLRDSSAMRPNRVPLTQEQQDAWHALNAAFGEETQSLTWPSAYDAVRAAGNEMVNQAAALLEHPAVKNAYEEFMLMCKLTKEPK